MTIKSTPILSILVWIALFLLAELAFGVLGRVIRPMRRILRGPYGAHSLVLIWFGAGVILFLGSKHLGTGEWWALAAVLCSPIAALLATGVYRDELRAAKHLPPAASENQALSLVGRLLSGTLGVFCVGTGVLAAWSGETRLEALLAISGMLGFGGLLLYAALKGRFPSRIA